MTFENVDRYEYYFSQPKPEVPVESPVHNSAPNLNFSVIGIRPFWQFSLRPIYSLFMITINCSFCINKLSRHCTSYSEKQMSIGQLASITTQSHLLQFARSRRHQQGLQPHQRCRGLVISGPMHLLLRQLGVGALLSLRCSSYALIAI